MAEAGSFADRVKQQADIVRVVGEYVRLKKSGQNFTGLCPFHSEKTPSFAVHPVKQIYHCFGCGAGGDVFKFVMEMDRCEFPEAMRTVAEKCGIALPHPRERSPEERKEQTQRTALVEMHKEAAAFFKRQLEGTAEGKAARATWRTAGLDDEALGAIRAGLCALGRRGAAAPPAREISRKAAGCFRADLARSRRAAVRSFPAAHHVSDCQRVRQDRGVRRAGAGRRPAEISELAGDADLRQEQRALSPGPRQGGHAAARLPWCWSRATWTPSPWRARAFPR